MIHIQRLQGLHMGVSNSPIFLLNIIVDAISLHINTTEFNKIYVDDVLHGMVDLLEKQIYYKKVTKGVKKYYQ